MRKLWLKCFGVGDGWPAADGNHSAFLYRFDDAAFLIDCGEPISRSFKASQLSYDLVDQLFISHLHFDHVGGFFMLVQGFWLEGRKKPLRVEAPRDGIEPLRQTLRAACIFDEVLPFPLEFQPLHSGRAVQIGGVQVTPFPTTHLAHFRRYFSARYPQEFAAFCFLVEASDLRVAHSADIGAPEDLAPLVQKPLDLLVCELAHMAPEELFRFLRGREIEHVVFVHVAREYRAKLASLEAQAREILKPMRISFAKDGEEFVIGS